ncbi:Hypothetical predicted protein [Mytilus galloprovincialis]|uniref:Protein kinase domain-containing protein n=1 Tax=Mytilus galloprovincialis TaxID=29158 RepID=A0A8B6EB92_MYTGA|nr:Hypothetical predicted protein [Mytilus galloprovincialis]
MALAPDDDNTKTYRPGPERAQTFSISRESIVEADDYGDIFEIADTMGIDLGGLDEIEDMKTRLILFYNKCEGEPNYKDVVGNSMVSMRTENRKKREKLLKLLTDTRDRLGPVPAERSKDGLSRRGSAVIKGFLKSEGTIQNLDLDINNKLEALKRDDCTIVVSGETSAGKSSILNLMFGEEVVPTFFGSCTSVITRICYYKQRRAKIIYKNGKVEKIRNIPPGEICKKLKPFVFIEDESERELATPIKEVKIYVPAKILECGLVVVDSPGIGENDEMDKVIVDFVNENPINGFLYAIKSDNAGGVDEDRLIGLLKVILETEKQKTERGMLPFESTCALFVCNFWDLIAEDQTETVFSHAYNRLKSIWPNMKESQLMKFSAFKAKMECDIDPDFIVDNYKQLLDNIRNVYNKAMDIRVLSTYKWLETVLKRSVHHLKTIVHRIDNSEKDLETKMRSVWDKLNTLKMKSELTINELRKQIQEETDEICEEFGAYLRLPKTRMAITSWIENELPDIEFFKNFEELKANMEDLTVARISRELENWEDEQGKIKNVRENVERSIQLRLNILEDELQVIEDDMQSEAGSITSEDSISPKVKQGRRYSIPIGAVQMQMSKIALPVKLVNRMFKPFGKAGKRVTSIFFENYNEGKLKEYRRDPITWAKRRSEKTLDNFLNDKQEDHLRTVISEFMKEPKDFLKDIERKIPAMVETNQKNMDHISMCRKEGSSSREVYERMMENLEHLKRTVTDYGEGYIFVNDFGVDDIQIISRTLGEGRSSVPFEVSQMLESIASSTATWNQKVIPRSLWSAQQNGILMANNKEESVTIRIYLTNARIENTDSEVAKLRLLKNENVAELLGIQNSDHPTPAFVFHGHLRPVSRFIRSKFMNFKEDVPRILHEVLYGLEYIHRKKMVHMELNQNTIAIDDNHVVKLCGACQPRVAPLPVDKDRVLAGDFVYLSPEVLNGDLYVACADIYAFGLLVFEILVGQAFKDQRQQLLSEFIDNCKPCALNGCPYTLENLSQSTKDIIQDCLDEILERRPSIENLNHSVSNIRNEPVLVRLQEMKRNNTTEKRTSSFCYERLRKEGMAENQPGVLRASQDIQHQITKEVGYNNETSASLNMDKTVSFLRSSSNNLGTKDLFDNKSSRIRAPLTKQMRHFSVETERYAGEQNDSKAEQSNRSKTTRAPQISILRSSSETPQSIGETPSEHLVARMTKSLEEKEESGSTGSQSPSRLRQS